jgi:hypothetical protein
VIDHLTQRFPTQDLTVLVHPPSLRLHPTFFNELTGRLEARKRLTEFRLKILVVYPVYVVRCPLLSIVGGPCRL